jgi:glutaredoxin
MKKLILLLAIFGAYKLWGHFDENASVQRLAVSHDKIIMYSLTTCGYCKLKARELDEAGISYQEYFIDKDSGRRDELTAKLQQAGFAPRSWGTPILDVKGVMLPNNPSLKKIREYL